MAGAKDQEEKGMKYSYCSPINLTVLQYKMIMVVLIFNLYMIWAVLPFNNKSFYIFRSASTHKPGILWDYL